MGPSFLEQINLAIPVDLEFVTGLFSLMERLGTTSDGRFEFASSNSGYYPRLSLGMVPGLPIPTAAFHLSDGTANGVQIENSTGEERQSPHTYAYVSLAEITRRLTSAGLMLTGMDHIGFNLPWFGPGVHPEIVYLRSYLASSCLYHRFPSGEAWDFILPGTPAEILGSVPTDYSVPRRPKFELVSFEKASKPLIQLETTLTASYEMLARLFPESLLDPHIGNCWVYLENQSTIDICLVLNPAVEGDWSDYFKGYRI